MAKELKVVADFYDFMLWLLRHVEKFPRHHRYSLGRDIEARLQTILAFLLRAKYSKSKASYLADANIEKELIMATNLALDDRLIEEAQAAGGHKPKKEAVTAAPKACTRPQPRRPRHNRASVREAPRPLPRTPR